VVKPGQFQGIGAVQHNALQLISHKR
jgi:hypothetical protein